MFSYYCKSCKKNLCIYCEKEHNGHEILPFQGLIKNKENIKNKIKEIEKQKVQLNKIIKSIKDILDNINYNIGLYYQIICDIYNSSQLNFQNYEILSNLNEINDLFKMDEHKKTIWFNVWIIWENE